MLNPCQFQTSTIMPISNFYSPINFKTPVVMSANFNLIFQYHLFLLTAKWPVRLQEQLVPVNLLCYRPSDQFASKNSLCLSICSVIGQVASSHPRTACACQFILVIGQVTSSNTRTTCTCQFAFILVIGQAASSNTKTACTCALYLSSAKRLVQIQEQLVLPTLLLSSAKRLVQIQEQLVPLLLVSIPGQVPSSSQKNNLHLSICYLVSPVSLVIYYLVNVYQSRNGYDIFC